MVTDTGKIVSHSFSTPGTFDVVLTAADGRNTGTSTLSVTVQDITPPSVNFNWSYVDGEESQETLLQSKEYL